MLVSIVMNHVGERRLRCQRRNAFWNDDSTIAVGEFMKLKGLDYLVVALGCAMTGISLVLSTIPLVLFGRGPDSFEYYYIVAMVFSVPCLWSSLKFLVLNRKRRDAIYFIIALAPILLGALYVTWEYLTHLIGTYYFIYSNSSYR